MLAAIQNYIKRVTPRQQWIAYWFAWGAALLVACAEAVSALTRPADRLHDLHVYYGAVHALLSDGTLYNYKASNGDPFTYPPFAGVILTPLQLLPEASVGVIWTASVVATIFLGAILVGRYGRRSGALKTSFAGPLIAFILAVSAPISSNIQFGQISWLLVLLVGSDLLGVFPVRARGIAIGIAAAIKLTPLIFIPYLWFSGQRRSAIRAVIAFTICTALGWVVLPQDSRRFWLTSKAQMGRSNELAQVGNQSLNGILRRLDMVGELRVATMIVVSVVVIVLGLWRASVAARSGHNLLGIAIVGAISLVLSPVSWTHHQVWLLGAAFGRFNHRWVTALWRLSVLVTMTISIGPAISNALPQIGWLGNNLRGFLAIAVATFIPFIEVRSRRSSETRENDKVSGGNSVTKKPNSALLEPGTTVPIIQYVNGGRKAKLPVGRWRRWLAIPAVMLAVGACGSQSQPSVLRPSGQTFVRTVGSGRVDSIPWRVEVVRAGGKLCTQPVVGSKIMATECDYTVAPDRPINLETEGNDQILFVDGVAGSAVSRLSLITNRRPPEIDVELKAIDGSTDMRYFGLAVTPLAVQDLVAYDSSGTKIYSGRDKIIGARDMSSEGPRSGPGG